MHVLLLDCVPSVTPSGCVVVFVGAEAEVPGYRLVGILWGRFFTKIEETEATA
jgi:hypothetical protein